MSRKEDVIAHRFVLGPRPVAGSGHEPLSRIDRGFGVARHSSAEQDGALARLLARWDPFVGGLSARPRPVDR